MEFLCSPEENSSPWLQTTYLLLSNLPSHQTSPLPATMASHEENGPKAVQETPYHAHDVLDETAKSAVVGLGAGFFIAAIQNAMSKRNVGAFGVFTRGAPLIGLAGTN